MEAQRDPGRALRRGGRHLGRDVVDQPAHRRARGGALEPAAPRAEPRAADRHRGARARDPTPWSPSPTTCAPCPTRWRASSTGPTPRSAPTGSAAPTPGTPCARYFEVDAAHLVVAVLQQLALGGRVEPAVVAEAIADLGIDRRTCGALHGVSTATKVAIASSAPSGTRRASVRGPPRCSMATSKKAQHCFSRCAERRGGDEGGVGSRRARGAPRWRRPRRATTDDATSARHSSTRSARRPGVEAAGDRRLAAASPPLLRHQHVTGDLHLAEVLEQLLEDVEQHARPWSRCRAPGRRGRAGRCAGAAAASRPDHVLGAGAGGRARRAAAAPATVPAGGELGGPVALRSGRSATVAPPQYSMTPRQWVRMTYGGVGAAEGRAPVGQLVAELLDDGDHARRAPGRRTTGSRSAATATGAGALAVSGRPRHRGR